MLSDATNIAGKELVLLALEQSKVPLTTKQIYNHELVKNRLSWKSVRVYLRQLLIEKRVNQIFPRGPYEVIRSTLGVLGGLRVHNVQLQVEGGVRESGVFDRRFGDVRVYITFGFTRGLVTCSIGKDAGLSWAEWLFAKDLFLVKCGDALGRVVSEAEVRVLNVEVGNDLLKRRLEGLAKCVTLVDLNGFVERIYQKGDSVRREVKIESTTVEQLEAFWRGGVTMYNVIQGQMTLVNELRELRNDFKRIYGALASLIELERERLKQ